MKNALIWLYITSFFFSLQGWSQEIDTLALAEETKKSRVFTLRLGADVIKPLRTQFEEDFQGLELVGDLQLNRRWFVAAEIGSEKRTKEEELIRYSTQGSYFKAGVDYNFFNNWKGMNNNMYVGFRYARSLHTHRVLSYELYQLNQYVSNIITEGGAIGERSQISNAWFELLFGIKVELLNNLYAGISLRLNGILVNPKPDNFGNLYAPGFNTITDDNKFGSSINYTLSYALPFRFKKEKKAKAE